MNSIYAQLGFCNGNSGDSIFVETFGTGTTNTTLPSGTTTYNYSNGYPLDGFYTVSNGTFSNPFDWHQTLDRTPGDVNGKCLIVNAATTAGEFFRTTINGLCETTTYEFSAWLINLARSGGFCASQPGGTIPINVRFEIWDVTDTNLLASGNTGSLFDTSTPNWSEYGLVFQTLAGQNTVILKMINNGQGGCGNDLAIDDIEFKSCGDLVTVTDIINNTSASLCSIDAPFASTLTANPDFAVYNSHFYQWQQSIDNGMTWNDLAGENNQTLSISVAASAYYRAKIAEVAINLMNDLCVSFSDIYEVNISQLPNMPTVACWETATINRSTCSWEVIGVQPTQPMLSCWETATFNNSTCMWEVTGTQPVQPNLACWESATFNTTTCRWDVIGTQPVQPSLACWETAMFNTSTCSWEVSGTQPIQPILSCWETATFNDSTCMWEVTGAQPIQPTLSCWQSAMFNAVTCRWDISGTQPTQPILACWETAIFNTTMCMWEVSGTQPIQPSLACWEMATFNTVSCVWDITGMRPGSTTVEALELCEGDVITLTPQTTISTPSYTWNDNTANRELIVNTPGTYTVEITDGSCSFETRIFNVSLSQIPIISGIIADGNNIVVNTLNTGDFLYAIDGVNFQSNNVFYDIEGGLYTITVKQLNCIDTDTLEYIHFYIPKFFTPNNDGFHDTFSLAGIEIYDYSQVSIFNRFGKLIKSAINSSLNWDGTFNGELLPNDDYWYIIQINHQKYTGHFTLKR